MYNESVNLGWNQIIMIKSYPSLYIRVRFDLDTKRFMSLTYCNNKLGGPKSRLFLLVDSDADKGPWSHTLSLSSKVMSRSIE